MQTPDVCENQILAESILDSVPEGVFAVDSARRITYFNAAAEQILGLRRSQALGRHCHTVFRSNLCGSACPLANLSSGGVTDKSALVLNAAGNQVPVIVSTSALYDREGKTIGGVETFRTANPAKKPGTAVEDSIGCVASSEAMRRIIDLLPQIAASDSTVLIQGETGTGKEVLARSIHRLSARRNRPFIAVNCAALPDSLLESELFGYKAGAFTGAIKDKPGRFALAQGGTIFLDEIGDISPCLQVRLLRVLQEKTFEPLGGTKSIQADVRVIVASNRNLWSLVHEKRFRQDLYYRVNVICLELPPLRKRREDIPALVHHFIDRFNRLQRRHVSGITQEAMERLISYDYPGNIRELENIIERAFVLSSDGLIQATHLPDSLFRLVEEPGSTASPAGLESAIRAVEIQTMLQALSRRNYNREAAARDLGMHRSTFFKKIKTLGIMLPDQDGRSARRRRNGNGNHDVVS
ncbi:MAG TPA: sigma 54-interacting transcriptional regulator [Acidobacteriota bacterium]|nr:sigma 54-interacting transcriptional regulator [Acidobacteriota bacterium]